LKSNNKLASMNIQVKSIPSFFYPWNILKFRHVKLIIFKYQCHKNKPNIIVSIHVKLAYGPKNCHAWFKNCLTFEGKLNFHVNTHLLRPNGGMEEICCCCCVGCMLIRTLSQALQYLIVFWRLQFMNWIHYRSIASIIRT
jgi:hypothetical protein